MKRCLLTIVAVLVCVNVAFARGMLIPVEPELPPLAMLNHHVSVTLEDQVAVTRVEQTFRNHTSRRLEATYVFPVPEGANVTEFAMWVDGQRVKGELLKADRAKEIYTNIVRQTKEPGLLEYIGSDLLSLKIFPVPPQGDQKVEVRFTALAKKEQDLVEYVYPLKTDRAAASTLEDFRLTLDLKSQQPLGNVYSPTHEITVRRSDDHAAVVQFERSGATLERDFQLFYTTSGQDIRLTTLAHRPVSTEDGYVMLLVSPRAELSKEQKVPRDIVFVLDTSYSMLKDKKIEQAKAAVRHCLEGLSADDRFGLINFGTTVNRHRDKLLPATDEQIKLAKGWVANQRAGGGTAIHEALMTALAMRGDEPGRMFTVVFLTDGKPTIGERNIERIVADVAEKNSAGTRIFCFGVGDDLNAVFLDQIAEKTRALSRYVRSGEDLEGKVAGFFDKISKPVLANLKLAARGDVQLAEVYPPQLPDLFHGDQLVVLARYQGSGPSAVVLDGKVGTHDKQFVYELEFAAKSADKPFVEELWARRKVGYLLDQIRINGEQQELVDAVVQLATAHGITTPYTSYLIMPDAPLQVASAKADGQGRRETRYAAPPALAIAGAEGGQQSVAALARKLQQNEGELARNRGRFQDDAFEELAKRDDRTAATPLGLAEKKARERVFEAQRLKGSLDLAQANIQRGHWRQNQVDKLGVDLSVCTNNLKSQRQLSANAIRRVANRRCMEYGGVWIDEAFTARTPTVSIKAQSDAYFRLLARQPQMKEVFQLGNHVVWISPNGTGVVIDTTEGQERITDREIDALFAAK